jgi:hypothetical protein
MGPCSVRRACLWPCSATLASGARFSLCHVIGGWPRWPAQSRGIHAGAPDDHAHASAYMNPSD